MYWDGFIILKGNLKEDFVYFKEEVGKKFEYGYSINMEKYSLINIIQYSEGFSALIIKLRKRE